MYCDGIMGLVFGFVVYLMCCDVMCCDGVVWCICVGYIVVSRKFDVEVNFEVCGKGR